MSVEWKGVPKVGLTVDMMAVKSVAKRVGMKVYLWVVSKVAHLADYSAENLVSSWVGLLAVL